MRNTSLLAVLVAFTLLITDGEVIARESVDQYKRPHGPNAPWNIPVKNLPLHPESDLYADRLWNHAADRPGNFNLRFIGYTYPVYYTDDATGTYRVNSVNGWGNLDGSTIPWNPNWLPPTGSDKQIIILDPPTGREWNLWQVEVDGSTVNISNGNLVPGSYHTKEDGFSPSRGVGIQYLAMLVRPEEIMQGEIKHALSMPISNPSKTFYVAPATKLEHPGSEIPNPIPEGMRFALDVTDEEIESWLATKSVSSATRNSLRIIARALRDYGWFITDTSGSAGWQFEERLTGEPGWEQVGLDEGSNPRDLMDGLLSQGRIYTIVPSDQYPDVSMAPPNPPTIMDN
jgi:hypothetical protein